MLDELVERFEQTFPLSAMARALLEAAISPQWVDEVFETHRQRQYPKELMFSTVVSLMTVVTLGLRDSVNAAAKQARLGVSVQALYDKINRTEPALMRALVQGSAQRLEPVVQPMGIEPLLPGWRIRIIDGNHLPASHKRLKPLRRLSAAALPGHSLVVYDPDIGLVTDQLPCEDAHAQERAVIEPLLLSAQPGEVWIADRNFCTRTIMQGWSDAGACFIVREHAHHPAVIEQESGPWYECGQVSSGNVFEQAITITPGQRPWRRISVCLDTPTEDGDTEISLWTNLPDEISAAKIADLYRKRWTIEGMFQRLEAVLNSELRAQGHPRAALLGFSIAVLVYNVLAVLKKSVEHANRKEAPTLDASTYYIAMLVNDALLASLLLLPQGSFLRWADAPAHELTDYLLRLAARIDPKRVNTAKHKRRPRKPKVYVDSSPPGSHVSTAKVLRQAREARP
jgi:IS4 transposase